MVAGQSNTSAKEELRALARVNRKISRIAILLSCASCSLILMHRIQPESQHTLGFLRRMSTYRQNLDGFLLDRGNILYDGRGEFDYLRGEPRTHSKGQYHDTTSNGLLGTIIDAKKGDVQISSGALAFKYKINNVKTDSILNYLHCNTRDSFTNELKAQAVVSLPPPPNGLMSERGIKELTVHEILLLRDATHSLNDWSESGILHGLCIDGLRAVLQHEDDSISGGQQQPYVSVTAIDLDPNASGLELYYAVRNLEKNGIVSGQPMIVVSPVESGKMVINLGAYASEVAPDIIDDQGTDTSVVGGVSIASDRDTIIPDQAGLEGNGTKLKEAPSLRERQQVQSTLDSYHTSALLLTHVVKVWITISAVDVLESSAEALRAFFLANIGVLSIFDQGNAGDKRASERLEGTANAQIVGFDGNYLRNPEMFVDAVSNFVY